MKIKVIGIIFCILFLSSSLSIAYNIEKNENSEKSSIKTDDSNSKVRFTIQYGRIINHGLEVTGFPFGWCYNITPVNVRYTNFIWEYKIGFYIEKGFLEEEPYYIPKDIFPGHGFISDNYIFVWYFYIV